MVVIPNAWHHRATSRPMRPSPTTPIVLPDSSLPMNLLRSHLPPLREETALGMFLASAMIRDIVSSAADRVLPPGTFMTRMPLQQGQRWQR